MPKDARVENKHFKVRVLSTQFPGWLCKDGEIHQQPDLFPTLSKASAAVEKFIKSKSLTDLDDGFGTTIVLCEHLTDLEERAKTEDFFKSDYFVTWRSRARQDRKSPT